MKIGKLYYEPESNQFVIKVATRKGRDKFVGRLQLNAEHQIWHSEIENVTDGCIVFRSVERKFTVAVGILIEQCIRIAQDGCNL